MWRGPRAGHEVSPHFVPPPLAFHRSRSLQASPGAAWAPIRIVAEYADLSDPLMSASLGSYVRDKLIPSATARWGALLQTRAVQGPLFASRQCNQWYPASSSGGEPKCASYGGALQCALGYGDAVVTVGTDKLGPDVYYPAGPTGPAATLPAGSGWAGADTVIFVTTKQTASCGQAGSGVLAYASSCGRDQLDRPIVGRINLCPGSLSADPGVWDFQLGIVVHEMGHALGFDSASWPLFRTPDGSPRTPRNPDYPWVSVRRRGAAACD